MKTRGVCRAERRETRWTFSGWATPTGAENTVRPRGYYRSCRSCTLLVLTLADVEDALALCRAVMADWLRRAGPHSDKVDTENVTGELYAHLWHLYNRWVPSFGDGRGTFTGYASRILARKINTFVARDVGDSEGEGRFPKAHSRNLATSYEGIVESQFADPEHTGRHERGGLDFALGAVTPDPTADHVPRGRAWLDIAGDSGRALYFNSGSLEA